MVIRYSVEEIVAKNSAKRSMKYIVLDIFDNENYQCKLFV